MNIEELLTHNKLWLAEEVKDSHKEIERLNSVIKEAREKIESVRIFGLKSGKTLIATLLNDVLEILDADQREIPNTEKTHSGVSGKPMSLEELESYLPNNEYEYYNDEMIFGDD